VLSDGVLGYTLLNCANLSQEKHDMVKATCDELSYKEVKAQLEKVGFEKSDAKCSYSSVPVVDSAKVKIESNFYSHARSHLNEHYSGNSSDEDLNGDRVYFSKKSNFKHQNDNQGFKLNPADRFGHIRACSFCKCVYHWLVDCPYAPASVKTNLINKGNRNNPSYKKTL
jgi:hypothetical protein